MKKRIGLKTLRDELGMAQVDKPVGENDTIAPELLVQLTDESQTAVYVTDYDTDELLFANKATLKLLHADTAVKAGQTCYEYLMHRSTPCLFCQKEQLCENRFVDGHLKFPGNNRQYKISSKIITWGGRKVHVHYAYDITDFFESNKQLKEVKEKDRLLLSNFPGGVSIYRMKKDGRVLTEYASDSLAKMFGYDNLDEYLAYAKDNAMINVTEEDAHIVFDAAAKSIATHEPINITFNVHVKDKPDKLLRLNASLMDSELGEDDAGVWYCVHTVVSETDLQALAEQKLLRELTNQVPVGIGIFESKDGVLSQLFINDELYSIIGETRSSRSQYFGTGTLGGVHPDDLDTIHATLKKLSLGANRASVIYRLRCGDGTWMWIRFNASVVERCDHYFKFYASFSNYNEIMKAQNEINYSRTMLKLALSFAKVLTWRYDCRTSTIIDSGTLGEVYHLPKVIENVPQSIIDANFIADESVETFRSLFHEMNMQKTATADVKAIAVDGITPTWFHLVYTPIFDDDGNYVNTIGLGIDITERKKQEFAYKDQLRLYQMSSKDSIAKVVLNLTQNTIVSLHVTGSEDIENKQFATANDMLASFQKYRVPEKDGHQFDQLLTCQRLIDFFENSHPHIEFQYHSLTTSKWYKITYDMILNPYIDEIEAMCSVVDVTEAVQSDLVINRLMAIDYQSIMTINAKTGIVYPLDHGQKIAPQLYEILDAKTQMRNHPEMLPEIFRKYCQPGTEEKCIKENSISVVMEHLKTNPHYETMYPLLSQGKKKYYRTVYTYLDNDKETILCAVQNVTDTYEKQEEQRQNLSEALMKAEAANKAKTAFLSRVSHDMRTPLNGILGLTALIKDNELPPQVAKDISYLELSGHYLLNLINDTLDVNRIESGNFELHSAVCDSRYVLNNVLKMSQQLMKEKGIHFVTDIDIPMCPLYMDEGRLQQLAINIMGNAAKFTPAGGTVTFICRNISVKDGIITNEFFFHDTGIGMSKDFLPHLFEAFSQEDAATTNSKKGTGLGMSITLAIVKLMGGTIDVESEPGKGTSVHVVLPFQIATKEQIDEYLNTRTHNSTYQLENKRILLFEDHPLNAQIAIRLLENVGLVVEHAENGKAGLQMFKASPHRYYDAILMDIRMPEMDGIDTTAAIRALQREDARSIPIIAVTANALTEDMEQTKTVGMNAHLSKPLDPNQLYSTLDMLINPKAIDLRPRILVVDDAEVNRAALVSALEKEYAVFEASNGVEALEQLENHHDIDVVITDIQMPVMDGVELIRRIRANKAYFRVPIIASTQFEAENQEDELIKLGVNDFIYKPNNPKIMMLRVRNVLRTI